MVVSGLLPGQVNVGVLLPFVEYLHLNKLTVSNIANYLAAIRALSLFMSSQLKALGMRSFKCSLMVK